VVPAAFAVAGLSAGRFMVAALDEPNNGFVAAAC